MLNDESDDSSNEEGGVRRNALGFVNIDDLIEFGSSQGTTRTGSTNGGSSDTDNGSPPNDVGRSPRSWFNSFEDSIMKCGGLVKLVNRIPISKLNESESMLKKGSDWKLSCVICVECENTESYNVVLTMKPSLSNSDKIQMSVCVQHRSSRKEKGHNLGVFTSCVVTMKFWGDQGVKITKHLNVERQGYCIGLNHRSGEDIASVTNSNFHEFRSLRELCRSKKEKPSAGFYYTHKLEFIPVEVQLCFKLRILKASFESNTNPETFRFSDSKRRKIALDSEPLLKKLRTDEEFADVTIKVGPTLSREFKAHKCVLGVRSPVFNAMLQVDMKEKSSGEIELPDVDPVSMTAFLSLVYETDEKQLIEDPEVALDVLELAHKYEIHDIVESCLLSLVSMPSGDCTIKVALDIYASGNRLGFPDLEFKALQCISGNTEKLNTQTAKDAIREFMKHKFELSPSLIVGLFAAS